MKDDKNILHMLRSKIAVNNLREAGAETKDENLAYCRY